MAKKASLLPKIEVLILAIFFFSFVVWMVPKCAATKADYQEAEAIEAAENALLAEDSQMLQILLLLFPALPLLPFLLLYNAGNLFLGDLRLNRSHHFM